MTGGLAKRSVYLLAGASILGLFAGVPRAEAQQTQDLQQIQAQIQQMQATIIALQKQVQDAKAQAAAANVAAANAGTSDIDLKVKWKGAPEFSSADEKKFKFKVRGRLETDYANINQDTPITYAPDVAATELRRARLGVEGVVFYDLKYVFEVDFANDTTAVKDAYIQYQGIKLGNDPLIFRAGNFKTPNTFENLTSDLFVDTMERAAFINAWEIDRQIGFMTAYWTDHWGVAAGVFGENPSSQPLFSGFIGDENVTFAARGTIAPINKVVDGDTHVLHFGASVRTRDVGDDQPFLQYRARGADFRMANFLTQTGRIGDGDTFWGLEAAALWGPFSIQGEYGNLEVDLPSSAFIRNNPPPVKTNPFLSVPDPDYNGWYIEGAWFFGGRQTYDKEGRWGRPHIDNPMRWSEHSGWGALQLVGKYDVIDLSDTAFNNAGGCQAQQVFPGVSPAKDAVDPKTGQPALAAPKIAQCGEQKTWLIGANWYLNDYTRIMFNYAESDLGNYPLTLAQAGTTLKNSVFGFDGATVRGFGMRAQVDW